MRYLIQKIRCYYDDEMRPVIWRSTDEDEFYYLAMCINACRRRNGMNTPYEILDRQELEEIRSVMHYEP